MRWYLALVLAGGCGRLAFDELPPTDAADTPDLCVSDDFEAGAAAWQSVVGSFSISPGAGPDGSAVLRTGVNSKENLVTHPALAGVDAARVEVDFAIDNATTGDFNIYFLPGTLGTREDAYEVGLFPTTGDNPPDEITYIVGGTTSPLVQHPPTIDADTWHHVVVLRRTDGSIRVDLDGAFYMESSPDTTLGPPFTIAVRLYNEGRIDNVNVDCAP
ncbi:MAG: hypothetical protein HOV81_14720 [Kofleriaceae bacterium]|nr:hypothetical protein [Kofleriaceae bacterium]